MRQPFVAPGLPGCLSLPHFLVIGSDSNQGRRLASKKQKAPSNLPSYTCHHRGSSSAYLVPAVPAPFSFYQAQFMCQVFAQLLGTTSILVGVRDDRQFPISTKTLVPGPSALATAGTAHRSGLVSRNTLTCTQWLAYDIFEREKKLPLDLSNNAGGY